MATMKQLNLLELQNIINMIGLGNVVHGTLRIEEHADNSKTATFDALIVENGRASIERTTVKISPPSRVD